MKYHIFDYGFRPLFLAAGCAAFVLIPLWVAEFAFALNISRPWPPSLWHAHEMLFGFVAAAVGGFMLTAVPSWTGQRGFAGKPLMLATAAWFVARLAIYFAAYLPAWFVAVLDLAFLPIIAALVAPLLLRESNRNTPLLGVLAVLSALNLLFHIALLRADSALAARCLLLAVDVVLVLISVIGGRVVPAFTVSGLKMQGIDAPIKPLPWITPAVICLMLAVVVIDAAWPAGRAAGLVAALAALAQTVRASQWRSLKTLRLPIVWVLHLAYWWLPLGLALKACYLLGEASYGMFWLHALTMGAAATMILAIMTRASLGHTGRALIANPAIALAYGLLTAAAAVRVFGLWISAGPYKYVIVLAGSLWTAGFGLFLLVYAPILWGPRADGKTG